MKPREIDFLPDHIYYPGYEWTASPIAQNPLIKPSEIESVRMNIFAPDIVLKTGETVFIPAAYKPELRVFTERHALPHFAAEDIWGDINEEFLDTEVGAETHERIYTRLEGCGLSRDQVKEIRKKIANTMLSYNAVLWDWVHLGHYDLLLAYKNFKARELSTIFPWSMTIARHDRATLTPTPVTEERDDEYSFDTLFYSDLSAKYDSTFLSTQSQKAYTAYSESHRAYHNPKHIRQMSYDIHALAARLDLSTDERVMLLLATWYHDFRYDPKSKTNEEDSARELLQTFPASEIVQGAAELIRFTAGHAQPKNKYEKIISDADLAIIGAGAATYDRYAKAIRQEYAHVSDEDFKKGRCRLLERHFLPLAQQSRLYHHFGQVFHANATENLLREISSLRT